MAFAPNAEYDIFISHRRPDREGWVRRLQESLQSVLEEMANAKPQGPQWSFRMFLDEGEIAGNEDFRVRIEKAVKNSAVMVIVMSNNYLDGDSIWCKKERDIFLETIAPQGGSVADRTAAMKRIFVVRKDEAQEDQWPNALRHRTGYQFWETVGPAKIVNPTSFDSSQSGRVPPICRELGCYIL